MKLDKKRYKYAAEKILPEYVIIEVTEAYCEHFIHLDPLLYQMDKTFKKLANSKKIS